MIINKINKIQMKMFWIRNLLKMKMYRFIKQIKINNKSMSKNKQ